MSRKIFLDLEEALSREVRRITFFNERTVSLTVLQDTYDVFTGEPVATNIEPNFYDSSADTNNIQYPHFFIKLLKTREDRFTKRVIPPYGQNILTPVPTAPQGYQIVVQSSDAQVIAPGNTLTTSLFKIRSILPNMFLRLLSGNNIGTYIISSVTINNNGNHTITLSNNLLVNLPNIIVDNKRVVYFQGMIDVNTIQPGDNFVDATSVSFPIVSVDTTKGTITLGGGGTPSGLSGGSVMRAGNVLRFADSNFNAYTVMDPTQPVVRTFSLEDQQVTTSNTGISPAIPIDAYYLVRIDSKERETHIEIMNRMWEEFNPPRTGLPIIIRNENSFEQNLTADSLTGSTILTVADTSGFNVNDPIVVFDHFHPTKNGTDGFESPFSSKIVAIFPNNQIQIANTLPSDFLMSNGSIIVSNADFHVHMFHFVDHNTRDNEGAQYWVHEFTFWVQIFVDRLETIADYNGVVQKISETFEDLDDDSVILQD